MNKYAIAILGCASNVGKSTVASAICRYFANQQLSVAPFKALNISLNSGVSYDSREMARSQISQAQACYKLPTVYMNPVLMKPSANNQMQVIVMGKVQTKKLDNTRMMRIITDAYNSLKQDNDLIVIEGSGSCCELNLKDNDLANFAFIERVNVNVILVANVEDCGVFASVYGTLALLTKQQRSLVKGIIINKFQGDVGYFDEAKTIIERICNLPVLGVIPKHHLNLPQEDGLFAGACDVIDSSKEIDIVIIKLPHMSNADEFQPLHDYQCVNVRYIDSKDRIGQCDILIIPGSKNTMSDLDYLKQHGFDTAIQVLASTNCIVLGICGGYQMLGRQIIDNQQVESKATSALGIGLLNATTHFYVSKETYNTKAKFVKDALISNGLDSIEGYEIHCGQTIVHDHSDVWIQQNSRVLACNQNNVYGTYLHGMFDNADFVEGMLKHVLIRKGLDISRIKRPVYDLDVYDQLTSHFEKYCDMERLVSIVRGDSYEHTN